MKLRKTPDNQRFNYIYYFDNGDKTIVEPGKATTITATGKVSVTIDESITEITIANLHREDDAIVRSNLKNINVETREEADARAAKKKQWLKDNPERNPDENPYDKPPRVASLDEVFNEDDMDDSKSKLEHQVIKYNQKDNPFEVEEELVHQFVLTLPATMQQLYELLYIKGLKQAEVCAALGLSKGTVSERVTTLKKKIEEHFSK